MAFMARLSRLSSASMAEGANIDIRAQAEQIHSDLTNWWQNCPPALRDQSNDWRRQHLQRKLTVHETLKKEAFSSIKSCMYGCIIYLNHILDPLGLESQKTEVTEAIMEILEVAEDVPRGHGLEVGHYWGLFMVGISVLNHDENEALVRKKLELVSEPCIYVGIS